MGWRFQRRKQLLPGVRANIGKRGLSSLSFGRRGARISVGRSGTQTTLTALGTGLSYIFRRGRRR
jgi:hypothetical protein